MVNLVSFGKESPYKKWFSSGKLIGISADNLNIDDFQKELKIVSFSKKEENSKTILNIKWAHLIGIEAEINYHIYNDTEVIDWEGRIYNRSKKIIKNIKPFSLFLKGYVYDIDIPHITSVYGGASTCPSYPPLSYRVFEQDGAVELICGREGGRSTETFIPTIIVNDYKTKKGFFLAYEWPCRSIIQLNSRRISSRKIEMHIWAHPGWIMFNLMPGESIYLPRINIGFFEGDGVSGSNALRRHIRKHILRPVMRPVNGENVIPPVFYNHWFGWGNNFTEEDLRKEADVYSELGIEYFVVDTGWFKGGFRKGIGNWDIVDRKKFSFGMENFAKYIEKKGMKFGAWIEIEFADEDSDWFKKNPDWFYEANFFQNPGYYSKRFTDRLLKLDNASIRNKVVDWLESWVNRYNIKWIRWDFNNTPLPFWISNEKEKMGKIHIEYGEGLLLLLDEFMKRCPDVHIESCAGGGHRADLGTLRRAHSLWMNDNSHSYNTIRRFQAGLNRVLTGNFCNSCFLYATHKEQRIQSISSIRKNNYPLTVLRSRMAGSLGFAEKTYFWTKSIKKYLKEEIEKYKSIRHFLMEEYYPLFNPKSIRDFDGWQFHSSEKEEGFFMIFRCDSPTKKILLFPIGLKKSEKYEVFDMDTGEKIKMYGGKEISVSIEEKNSVKWFRYKMI